LTLSPVAYGYGGTWNADGVILFSQGAGKAIARISATGGAVTEATRLEHEARAHAVPVFLPDGSRFLFASAGGKAPGTYMGWLDGRAPVRLTTSAGNFAFHPSGWLLHWPIAQGVLIAQRLDADKPALVGAPLTLAEGDDGRVTTSATGLVAYWSSMLDGGPRQLVWRNRSGAEMGTLGAPDPTYFSPRVSRDGQRVVVSRGAGGPADVWVLESGRTRRITFGGDGSEYPLWSPDGARIVFNARSEGDARELQQIPADGAGEASSLLDPGSGTFAASSWSPDGRYLLYVVAGSGTGLDLAVLPMTGDRKVWKFLDSTFDEGGGEFSPDGKWVAYESNESARREVYVRPFVEPSAGGAAPVSRSGKWQVSIEGGTYPKWSPDGSELYFLNPAGEMMAAPITYARSAIAPGTPVKLFDAHILGGGTDFQQGPQYDVAPDGRFLINTVPGAATGGSTITLIQNWNLDAGK
jgi:Tol biopolymer transport system component